MGLSGILYHGPIIVVIISTLLYHIAQKSITTEMNPIAILFITYLSALILCLAAFPLFRQENSLLGEIRKANWSAYALGLAVLGIEVGFLYAYKGGWNISKAYITTSSIVMVLLITVGILIYHEKVSFVNIIGIIMCMAGVGLLRL